MEIHPEAVTAFTRDWAGPGAAVAGRTEADAVQDITLQASLRRFLPVILVGPRI